MFTAASSITAVNWQPALGQSGQVVTDEADIDQSVRVILGTPVGADPTRPTFGSNLIDYLDWPSVDATPHLVRETVDALRRWEPRIEVASVSVGTAPDGARTIAVSWRALDGDAASTTRVPA